MVTCYSCNQVGQNPTASLRNLSQVPESFVLYSQVRQTQVPLNQTKKQMHRSESVSLTILNSVCTSQEKPHETTGSIHTNEYQCIPYNSMTNYSSLAFLTTKKSWVSASMINDHATEAANSTVYLCIYLRQKWGQLSKTLAIWLRRDSFVFLMAGCWRERN